MPDPLPSPEGWPRHQPPPYNSPPPPYNSPAQPFPYGSTTPYGSAARPYPAPPRPSQGEFAPGGRPRHTTPPAQKGDLRLLRGAYRTRRRVATLTALGYFTVFLFLSAFAPSLMDGTVSGGLSTGLFLGLLQVPITWTAIALYEYTARRGVDPIADRIREQAERARPEAVR